MSHSVTPFNFGDSSVRVLRDEAGDPRFVAADVAKALGHSNPSKAVADHVDPEDRGLTAGYTPSGQQNLLTVNESGLYALIFGSRLERARDFKRWVTAEVLPAVRKDGGYISPEATPDQLAAIALRATTLAEAQARMLKAAEGLVDPKWLESKTRHVLARGLGEEPEIAPEDRPLTADEYLGEKGVSGAALRSTRSVFGKAVKAEFVAEYGREPGKADRFVDGTTRQVFAYTEADRILFDRAWLRLRPSVA